MVTAPEPTVLDELAVGCRFRAGVDMGGIVRDSYGSDWLVDLRLRAAEPVPGAARTAVVAPDMLALSSQSPELRAALDRAFAEKLPSMYLVDGLTVPATMPVIHEHDGPVLGRVYSTQRAGDWFRFSGWILPDARARFNGLGASPGVRVDDARIMAGPAGAVLYVTRGTMFELSPTRTPAHPGAYIHVLPAIPVPSSESFSLAEPVEYATDDPPRLAFSRPLIDLADWHEAFRKTDR
jgi:hypothetical protein